MTPIRRRLIAAAALASVAAISLAACGGDDKADPAAAPTTASSITSPPSPAATSTPSTPPTATPTPTATTTPTPTQPAASPTDDENGELAGQLIIEYPGKPLKRTTSKTPNQNVEEFQVRLVEVGYKVDTDGIFDSGTEAVVKKFQYANGLTADGIVGASTWAALFTFEG